MYIQLHYEDIEKMAEPLKTLLLEYLQEKLNIKDKKSDEEIISNNFTSSDVQPTKNKAGQAHIRFSDLFDAGITKVGMSLRIKLTKERWKQLGEGRDYINGLEISPKGTVIYQGKEYDKVSPLAGSVNNTTLNGWDYIEVKKNDEWISIDKLRQDYLKISF